jgi:hypothetical protein
VNTRRYPRTLQQAFGPYTDSRLLPMNNPPSERSHVWATRVLAVILVATIAALFITGGQQ